ncbi:Neurogenic locus protein delta [Trichoplax sp. H2]|nr:Neurogenic locus protein delta [Trichoplax sp. H2]|eukprot:RDD43842.1 Neurogenic locus protein delta [Trichoplax sp. H2]
MAADMRSWLLSRRELSVIERLLTVQCCQSSEGVFLVICSTTWTTVGCERNHQARQLKTRKLWNLVLLMLIAGHLSINQVNCQYSTRARLMLELVQYYNPNERLYDGRKCDVFSACDYVFEIAIGTSGRNNSYYSLVTNTFENGQYIQFSSGTALASNVGNPIRVPILTALPASESIQLSIIVKDNEFNSKFEIVDFLRYYSDALSGTSLNNLVITGTRTKVNPSKLTVNFKIECGTGWEGPKCDRAICRSGCSVTRGSCNNSPFTCSCNPGWTGSTCDSCIKLSGCVHGYCRLGNDCTCSTGWQGSYCNIAICSGGCNAEHGRCASPDKCLCDSGWTGTSCDTCIKSPHCSELHGYCLNGNDCLCHDGWGGPNCDKDLNPCSNPNRCKNGGTCQRLGINTYRCNCLPRYTGGHCEYSPPDKPQVRNIAINATQIAITWDKFQSNGGYPLVKLYFRLDYYQVSSFGSPVPGTRSSSSNISYEINEATISHLLPVTYYSVSVIAFNGIGKNSSSWRRVKTIGYPPHPPIINRIVTTMNAIDIEWNITSTGGYDISEVQSFLEYQKWSDYFENREKGLTKILLHHYQYRIDKLQSNTGYRLRITVKNPIAKRSSIWINETTYGVPGLPIISSLISTSTTIIVRWLPSPSNGGYTMSNLSYNVEYLQADGYQEHICPRCTVSPSVNNVYFLLNKLTIGSPYVIRIKATNPGGESYSSWRRMSTKGYPRNVKIDQVLRNSTSLNITWFPVVDNGGYSSSSLIYFIEYINKSSPFSNSQSNCDACKRTNNVTTTFVVVYRLTVLTEYYVRLHAINPTGDSKSSWQSTTTLGYPPDAPTGITIVADAQRATITYKRIKYYGGYSLGSITFYARYLINNGQVPNTDCTNCYKRTYGTESSIQLTGLLVGTVYYIQVVAANEAGQNASHWERFTTKGKPSSVTGIRITVLPSGVIITWDHPAYTGGYDHSQITYFVEYGVAGTGSDGCQSCTTIPTNRNTTVTLRGLGSSREYRIRVIANSPAGVSASNWTSVWTRGVPSAPSDILIGNITSTSVLISWTAAKSYNDQNSTDVAYRVKYSIHRMRDINCSFCRLTSPTWRTFIVLTGLESYTAYDISVVASNNLGSKSSTWFRFVTLGQQPQMPQIINTEATSSSITVRWKLQDYNGGYDMKQLSYYLQYLAGEELRENSTCHACHNTSITQANHIQIAGLSQNTRYNIRVVAVNPAGTSVSKWMKVSTTGLPERPTIVSTTAIDSSLIIQWNKLSYNGGYPVENVIFYVQYSTKEQQSNSSHCQLCLLTQPVRNINVTVGGLNHLTLYWIRVLAENVVGRSYSRWHQAWTLGYPPGLTSITSSSSTPYSIFLTWREITDNGLYSINELVLYVQYVTKDFKTQDCRYCHRVNTTSATSVVIPNLISNTIYKARVIAQNTAGSTKSAWKDIATKNSIHSGIEFNVIKVTSETATIKWTVENPTNRHPHTFTIEYVQSNIPVSGLICLHCHKVVNLTITQYQLINLSINTIYKWRIKVYSLQETNITDWKQFKTTGPPDKPHIIAATTNSSTAAITWTSIDYNGGYDRSLLVYYAQYTNRELHDDDCLQCMRSRNITVTTAAIKNLNSNSNYWVRIISHNPTGKSYGNWMKIKTKGLPDKPKITSIVNSNITTILVDWDPIRYNGGYDLSLVVYYVIFGPSVMDGGIPSPCEKCNRSLRTSGSMAMLTSFIPHTYYSFRVVANNVVGSSSSPWEYFKTRGLAPNLLNISRIIVTTNSIAIFWQLLFSGGYPIEDIEFFIQYIEGQCQESFNCTLCQFIKSENWSSFTINQLPSNTNFCFRVAASNEIGTCYSQWISRRTLEPTVSTTKISETTSIITQSQPTLGSTAPATSLATTKYSIFPPIPHVTAVEGGWNYINISWISLKRTIDPSTFYFIRYKEQVDENMTCYDCLETSAIYQHHYLLKNLRNDTIYLIQVVAENMNGKSFSPIVQVKTKAPPQSIPAVRTWLGPILGGGGAAIVLMIVAVIFSIKIIRKRGALLSGNQKNKQRQQDSIYEEIDNFTNVLYESGSTLGLKIKNDTGTDLPTNITPDSPFRRQASSINSTTTLLTDSGIFHCGDDQNKPKPAFNHTPGVPQLQRSLSDDECYSYMYRQRSRANTAEDSSLL